MLARAAPNGPVVEINETVQEKMILVRNKVTEREIELFNCCASEFFSFQKTSFQKVEYRNCKPSSECQLFRNLAGNEQNPVVNLFLPRSRRATVHPTFFPRNLKHPGLIIVVTVFLMLEIL